ncbi:thioesterase II family protein [Aquimarina sp. RZ0]|uniref:thioesterase II family protein n=1 Tax=Aquimarina sp. RZ0 TaxID=2607730 RepID=UPI0011F3CE90|nr:thioesterase domain-containing protein [Aquimarina sp. RZ0]KAA1244162.1 thioesterase [Aquimarina sp. RZ0]
MRDKKLKHKIIAIPFAGGNKFSFRNLEKYIPDDFEWVTLELPGRGDRFNKPFLTTMKNVIDDLFDQLLPHIEDGVYMIYGHSLGTLLGYELTKKLVTEGMPLPCCLYVTGRGAPSSKESENWGALPLNLFWKKVHEIGGLPQEVLETTEFLEFYYPILRSDFELIESYEYKKLKTPLPIPIYVCLGSKEIGEEDHKASIGQIKAWNDETIHTVVPEFLEGDHFFILKRSKAMIQKICKAFEMSLHKKIICLSRCFP